MTYDLCTFHNGHCLASMDAVLSDRVTIKVSYGLHPVRLAIDLNLI